MALLPFIDEERLLSAMRPLYNQLNEQERLRNEIGDDLLFVAVENKLYDDLGEAFYAKKQGVDVFLFKIPS